MLASLIIQELAKRWSSIDQTVEEGIEELTQLCAHTIMIDGKTKLNEIPTPRDSSQKLLDAATVKLPTVLPHKGVKVATRVKLPGRRISN